MFWPFILTVHLTLNLFVVAGAAGHCRHHPGPVHASVEAPPPGSAAGSGGAVGGAPAARRAEGGGAKTGVPEIHVPEHGEDGRRVTH